ncbi:hypothetical protein VT84_13385 [Gemmata sp. SH-PL17]|uniref:DUF971 domain-containing protein n=1 Tax=Gemmata sp. SH-PL17 TaxID=1630693 RepID=UPI0004BBE993|nr:DUF971 domain-containing protein [Gemmata sp. SH-PL17]AMV25388.1 hypothetical protein VT84_13385 [Gemmata sp. SH-PL17]
MADELRPLSLKREGDGLKIEWSDGVTTVASWKTLRAKCPCATCNEERGKPVDPFRILSPQEVAAGAPAPVAMTPVGYYAYQIKWNDGHDTGIYPLTLLRELSERSA